ncbi:asparagine synthase (glutamine-hydrolyzing) [Dechloromonas sp. ZY10]|uniref:asparagine synthase (glutamine-hydrolyzing) n=1 Tax=Dechloromonas aquae TaxID=2664436 RepID=UPI0035297564
MCGIGGFFGQDPGAAAGVAAAMLEALAARGPDARHARFFTVDGENSENSGAHALLHARLSIIDPRPLADQPMASSDGRYWLCYNGEVYGWEGEAADLARDEPFRSRSDSEYLLRGAAAWGVEALLPKLTGMFAFAFIDWQRRELVLARDRYGKKPLLWWSDGRSFAFSSLLRGLLPALPAAARRLSAAGLDAYLAHRYIPAPLTCVEGVQRLPAGHLLRWPLDGGEARVERWYAGAPAVADEPPPGDWKTALDQAIERRCVADRPVGLFLSGGIDSSVIATRLAALGHRFAAFTAAFPDTPFDETAQAASLCRRLGLQHHVVPVPTSIRDDFPAIVAALDDPFADPSAIPLWYLAQATSREVKVVLGGDGGDELLAGYKRYRKHLRNAWRGRLHWPGLPAATPRQSKAQRWREELANPWADAYQLRFSGMSLGQRRFLQPSLQAPAHYWAPPPVWPADPLLQLLAIDRANYLPEYILRKGDLTTMGHGLELRAPLLDHHFVHAVEALPAARRFTAQPKRLLAEVLPPDLAQTLFDDKKRGFNPPLRHWLQHDLADRYAGLGGRLAEHSAGRIDAAAVERMLELYRGGAEDLAENILQLLILDESLQQLQAGGLRCFNPHPEPGETVGVSP